MSENLPNIDDLFRKAIGAHEEAPSDNVWASIDKNLDKKKVVSIARKYKNLKWVAAALLIFSAGMAMYTWNTRLKNKELVKQNEVNKRKVPSTSAKPGAFSNTDSPANLIVDQSTVGDTAGSQRSMQDKVLSEKAATAGAKPSNTAVTDISSLSKKEPENNHNGVQRDKIGIVQDPVLANKTSTSFTAERPGKVGPLKAGNKEAVAHQDKPVIPESGIGMTNAPAFETVQRKVEAEVVGKPVPDLALPLPPVVVSPILPFQQRINDGQTAATQMTAANKSAVKLHFGSKISATLFYSPDFVSTRVNNDRRAFREEDRNEIKNKETISNSSSKGILVNYQVSNHWSLQSGLTFSTMTTEIAPKTIFARPDDRGNVNYRFNCLAGYSYVTVKAPSGPAAGDSITALSSKNTLHYLGVPFNLSYRLFKGRFSLQPTVGVTANFLTSGTLETSIAGQSGNENKNIDHIEGLNASYLNGSISLAANYRLTRNLALSFTPVSRFALGAINKDAPVKTYINSFGLATGLTISF